MKICRQCGQPMITDSNELLAGRNPNICLSCNLPESKPYSVAIDLAEPGGDTHVRGWIENGKLVRATARRRAEK